MMSCMITGEEFDALLDRRITLRERHRELCEICNENNGPFVFKSTGYERERDRVWEDLNLIENEIEEQLRIEREAEQI